MEDYGTKEEDVSRINYVFMVFPQNVSNDKRVKK